METYENSRERRLAEIPDYLVEDYLHSLGLLLGLQKYNLPFMNLEITNQQQTVINRRKRLIDEINRREIAISPQELSEYLIRRGITLYKERQAEYQKVVGEKTPEELLRDAEGDVDKEMEIIYPQMQEENFRLLVEKTLRDEFQL